MHEILSSTFAHCDILKRIDFINLYLLQFLFQKVTIFLSNNLWTDLVFRIVWKLVLERKLLYRVGTKTCFYYLLWVRLSVTGNVQWVGIRKSSYCYWNIRYVCMLAWPHFCRTQLHSPPNGDFYAGIWASQLLLQMDVRAQGHEATKITKIWFSKSISYVKNQYFDICFC